METQHRRKPTWLKVILGILTALFLLIAVTVSVFFALWHDEIATISSIQLLRDRYDLNGEGAVYTMG